MTGFLNAKTVAKAVYAYAAQLSLGASVAEYLHIPKFDPTNTTHVVLSDTAKIITNRGGNPTSQETTVMDKAAKKILGIP